MEVDTITGALIVKKTPFYSSNELANPQFYSYALLNDSTLSYEAVFDTLINTSRKVSDHAKTYGFSEEKVSHVNLTLDELLPNGYEHGNQNNPALPLHLTAFFYHTPQTRNLHLLLDDGGAKELSPQDIVSEEQPDPFALRGRGTSIIELLAQDYIIIPHPQGNSFFLRFEEEK